MSTPRDLPTDILTAMTPAEGAYLRALAAESRTILELGAYCGYSTVVMAQAGAQVYSVDWHRGDIDAGPADTLATYMDNLDRYRVSGRVVPLVGTFQEMVPTLAWAIFDGAFLDGQHDMASVERDLLLIEPHLRPRAWIACHDYGRFGVAAGIEHFCEGGGWHVAERVQTLVVLREGADAQEDAEPVAAAEAQSQVSVLPVMGGSGYAG